MKKFLAFTTALFAIAAACAAVWGFSERRSLAPLLFQQRKLELLAQENDRLRTEVAREKSAEAHAAQASERTEIEKAVVRIRGLDFLHPVEYAELTRAGVKKTLLEKLTAAYSDQDFDNMASGLSILGLLPPHYPLKQKYIDLLSEQVAAFYDQHQHKLFMFEDAALTNSQNRVVLAHELTHALQDQHFGLQRLPLESKDNDDAAFAASALIEGDATLVMSDYMLQNFSLSGLRQNLGNMMTQNMNQLAAAPRYLREMLVFPYLRGQEFCLALEATGGYAAVSEAYRHPPLSTSQILHPEKYLSPGRQDPVPIEFPDVKLHGETPIDDNVLGEMGIRIQLSEWVDAKTGQAAATGWAGDRYLVYKGGDALLWRSVWNDEAAAGRFFDAETQVLRKRYGAPGTQVARLSFEADGKRYVALVRDGKTVTLMDAANGDGRKALREKFP